MINSEIVKLFIEKALKDLDGDWVIIGGTVLSLLGIEERVTIDIDFISISRTNSNLQTIKLMELAETIGLPIETINQSGEFYLHKIPDFIENLVLLAESKRCKIYRPNAYLFFSLKLARMSETDINDCLLFMKYRKPEIKEHKKEILYFIKSRSKSLNLDKKKRLKGLISRLEKIN
jgi:hypothetical protein